MSKIFRTDSTSRPSDNYGQFLDDDGQFFDDDDHAAQYMTEASHAPQRTESAIDQMERLLIGALLYKNELHDIALDLAAEHFKVEAYGAVFKVIRDVMSGVVTGIPRIDAVTCASFSEVARHFTPTSLQQIVDEAIQNADESSIAGYVTRITDQAARRKLEKAVSALTQLFHSPSATKEQIDRALHAVQEQKVGAKKPEISRIGKFSQAAIDEMREQAASGGGFGGIETDWSELNRVICGLSGDELIIVAGRPAMGKTSFAFGLSDASAKRNKDVLFFSLEMSGTSLAKRMLAMKSKVSAHKMRSGALSREDWAAIARAQADIDAMPMEICEQANMDINELAAQARRKARTGNLGLIVVDYLQLMTAPAGSKDNRVNVVSDISRGLKLLAKELKVPVVALSQLNRTLEQRQDKRPMMADLRESGAIEQDADIIMFVYRDEVYNPHTLDVGKAEIIVGKNRHGPTATVTLGFDNRTTLFYDLPPEHASPASAAPF